MLRKIHIQIAKFVDRFWANLRAIIKHIPDKIRDRKARKQYKPAGIIQPALRFHRSDIQHPRYVSGYHGGYLGHLGYPFRQPQLQARSKPKLKAVKIGPVLGIRSTYVFVWHCQSCDVSQIALRWRIAQNNAHQHALRH